MRAKRGFDVVAAAVALAVLWPLMGMVAVAVRFAMPGGPVLFRQTRIGRDGEPFTILKFRTMRCENSGNGEYRGDSGNGEHCDGSRAEVRGESVAVAGDRRVTRLGAWLRRWKLDELPQLWNVLRGDMSLVGPRPDVPGYADRLTGIDREILRLRPGITGPASLKYRDEERLLAMKSDPVRFNDEVIFPDKVRINLYYLRHYSFAMDLKMILCTLTGRRMMYGGERI